MNRLALVPAFAVALAVVSIWTGRAQSPPAAASAARFTGKSTQMESKDLTIARRRFEAGARTFWHSHERGQLLMVEQGKMRSQKRGGPMREMAVGDSEFTPPNIAHWHGAAPDQPVVQINVGFGGTATWLEEVSASDYSGKTR